MSPYKNIVGYIPNAVYFIFTTHLFWKWESTPLNPAHLIHSSPYTLNQEANKVAGCLGARVTGAGFGGCAIALVHKETIPGFIKTVGAAYQNAIGYEATFFECSTGNGAGPLN